MRSRSGGITSKSIAVGATIILFAGICLLPVIYMFVFSFVDASGHFSIANYQPLFIDERQRALLLNSGLLGAGATVVAMVIGVPVGIILARSDIRVKRLIRLLLIIPLATPSFILALAWIYIGGTAGVAAQVTGVDFLSPFTYSLTGAMVVIGLNLFPLAMLATESAARRVEGHLEEAAMLVATSNRVFWRITIPLISPNIAAAALIIFVLAISEFAVPSLLRVPVFTSEIFTAFAALYEFGAATALAIPLLIMALIAGVGVKVLIGNRIVSTRRSSCSAFLQWHGPWKFLGLFWLLAVLLVSVLLPLAVLSREAGGMKPIVAAIGESSGAIFNSLSLAAVGAVLVVSIASVLGYGAARSSGRIHNFSDVAFLVTFAVPGTVVGIGLINIWNRPGLPSLIYQSLAIIVVAYIARLLPVAALILSASVRQISPSLEEAAEISGAQWGRTFTRIILPQMNTGLGAAIVIAFILAFGEIGATVLVTPPGNSTLPIHIYTMIANAPSNHVAALALMQTAIILVPLVTFAFFLRGNPPQNRRHRVR